MLAKKLADFWPVSFFPRKSLEGRRAFKIKDFIEQAKRISLEELQQVSGFGPRIAQSIYDWFHDQKH